MYLEDENEIETKIIQPIFKTKFSCDSWYCQHGYFEGEACPDCSVPSYWPSTYSEG